MEYVADKRKHVEHGYYGDFAEILSRFEREFGADHIRFELFDMSEKLGIAYRVNPDGGGLRIAYSFKHDAGMADADKAINHLREWIKNPVCPPGVPERHVLAGNEISAELL